MMNDNMMVRELNDNELDMVNGAGILDKLKDIVEDIAPTVADYAKEAASAVWDTVKSIPTITMRLD